VTRVIVHPRLGVGGEVARTVDNYLLMHGAGQASQPPSMLPPSVSGVRL
jgi:hypothetical protein